MPEIPINTGGQALLTEHKATGGQALLMEHKASGGKKVKSLFLLWLEKLTRQK